VKDYYNLLSVYLDATFFPKLEPFDFMQEGHRLEFEKIDGTPLANRGMCQFPLPQTLSIGDSHQLDPSSALKFKGVVYNEMKGAMVRSVCVTIFCFRFLGLCSQ
jgi:Zn-dependent M16 (insulinase) family peptidase